MFTKGQLRIQETILAVFIFVIVIIAGLIFFFRFSEASILSDNLNFKNEMFNNLILTFPNKAVISCENEVSDQGCLDSFKLIAFKNAIKRDQTYYDNKLGFKTITVQQVYPKNSNIECNINNVGNCNKWVIYDKIPSELVSNKSVLTPISIYLPSEKKTVLGFLEIRGYNV